MMEAAINYQMGMADEQKRKIASIISDYSKRLLGFISKRVANEADAEDILQDVFYQLAGSTQPIEQLTGWLFRVARNRITDVKRKHKLELLDDLYPISNEDDILGWADILRDLDGTPETSYLRTLFWETLNDALEELPKEQKEVFVLNELEGVPFKLIAL